MMESPAPVARLALAGLDPRRWQALALLCGAFFMVLLDGTITLVALPSIGADLGFSKQDLPWVLSAYALTFGGLLLLGGRAADLLGRRRVFMAGIVLFTAASLMCGLAWSSAALVAARAVQGAGAAIMTPTALSIISTTFTEGAERNKALGIWGALGGIGATTAWLIGGPLVDGPGWRWIFFINVPIGLAALALSPVLLRESRAARGRRGTRRRLGRRTDNPAARRLGRAGRRLRADRVAPPRTAGAAAHLPLPDPGRRGRPDDPDRHRRGRHAVSPDALRPAGARLLGPQVRHQLGRARARGHGRRDRRPGRGRQGRLPPGRRDRPSAHGRGVARAHAGPHTAATSRTSSSGCSCGPGDRPGLRDRHGRGARWGRRSRGRARLGPEQHRLAAGTAPGVAIVTTVAVSRSQHYLAAHKGANPPAVLTEGYQSAF